MKKGWLYILILVGVIGLILLNNQTDNTNRDTKPEVGFVAPDFTLTNQEGEMIALNQYKGKPVVVYFWATWCPYCKEQMPYIQEAYDRYQNEVIFLGINVTSSDSKEAVNKYMDSYGYEMPVLFDYDGNVTNLYRSNSIPTSFFIDKDGIVKVRRAGSMNFEQIEDYIKKSMEE